MNDTRDKGTGRYELEGKWDRLCKCGHKLGIHAAEVSCGMRPCFNGDTGEPCDCEKFRAAPKPKAQPAPAA